MSNLKNPLLSLDARGTLSKALTFTKRRGQNIAEKKPELPFFLTLPVQYQRWLYQDYAYLWTQQSQATKQVYATAGTRFHLTGFQYWMKYQLTNLPDIAGWWKLDANTTPITPDSSKNNLDGTVVGASPVTGLVSGGLYFDGLNDVVTTPPGANMTNFTEITFVMFLKPTPFMGNMRYFLDLGIISATFGAWIRCMQISNHFSPRFKNTAGGQSEHLSPFTPDTWCSYIVWWDGANLISYTNNVRTGGPTAFTGTLGCGDGTMTLGKGLGFSYGDISIDNLIIFRRALDAVERGRWSARRWP